MRVEGPFADFPEVQRWVRMFISGNGGKIPKSLVHPCFGSWTNGSSGGLGVLAAATSASEVVCLVNCPPVGSTILYTLPSSRTF